MVVSFGFAMMPLPEFLILISLVASGYLATHPRFRKRSNRRLMVSAPPSWWLRPFVPTRVVNWSYKPLAGLLLIITGLACLAGIEIYAYDEYLNQLPDVARGGFTISWQLRWLYFRHPMIAVTIIAVTNHVIGRFLGIQDAHYFGILQPDVLPPAVEIALVESARMCGTGGDRAATVAALRNTIPCVGNVAGVEIGEALGNPADAPPGP